MKIPTPDDDTSSSDSEPEEEDITVSGLADSDQELMTLGHSWDNTSRGGRIRLHPNAPDICIPAGTLGEMVQGIQSRALLKRGRHCWKYQQVLFYTPGCSTDEKPDNLIVGVGEYTQQYSKHKR